LIQIEHKIANRNLVMRNGSYA